MCPGMCPGMCLHINPRVSRRAYIIYTQSSEEAGWLHFPKPWMWTRRYESPRRILLGNNKSTKCHVTGNSSCRFYNISKTTLAPLNVHKNPYVNCSRQKTRLPPYNLFICAPCITRGVPNPDTSLRYFSKSSRPNGYKCFVIYFQLIRLLYRQILRRESTEFYYIDCARWPGVFKHQVLCIDTDVCWVLFEIVWIVDYVDRSIWMRIYHIQWHGVRMQSGELTPEFTPSAVSTRLIVSIARQQVLTTTMVVFVVYS